MISVILPTRNPPLERLARVFDGLARQEAPRESWELIVVDNGSTPPLTALDRASFELLQPRIVVENAVGLTPARLAGIRAARGEILVFVDDDNVLAPDFLAIVARRFAESPSLGAAGGPVVPEWEVSPPAWTFEFHGLLALRDFGATPQVALGATSAPWPDFAPVGAGLAVRRSFAVAYAEAVSRDPRRRLLDRAGQSLASGGDNDLVFTTLHAGGDIAYVPEMRLLHLIPAARLEAAYLARLNRGIMRTWVQVLAIHGQCPWPPIPRWTVALRAASAWVRRRAWRLPAARVRWAGDCGQFQGQAELSRLDGR